MISHPDVTDICCYAEKTITACQKDLPRKKLVDYLKLNVMKNAFRIFSDATIIYYLYGQDILDTHKI